MFFIQIIFQIKYFNTFIINLIFIYITYLLYFIKLINFNHLFLNKIY